MVRITLKANTETSTPKKNLAISFSFFAQFFNWFIVIICVCVLGAGYWWLIRPKYIFVTSNQEVVRAEKQYEQKISYLKQLNEVKNIYRSISQSDKDKIDTILSSNFDIDALKISLLREISFVGRLNGVSVDNIDAVPLDNSQDKFLTLSPDKKIQSDKLKIVKVSFTLNGANYDSLKRIVGRLEKNLRLMDVTQFDFNPSSNQAKVELFAYYLQK